MTSKNPVHNRIRPGEALERTHTVRAFWKGALEPIHGRDLEGKRISADRTEGTVMIRIDSPDADNRRRDISFRAMAFGKRLFILGIGKASQTRNEDGDEVKEDSDLLMPALPKNIMDFFMDLRKAIETQWSDMQGGLGERLMSAQGIVSARFRYKVSKAELMQTNLIEAEEENNDGKGEKDRGSVRKLREAVE